MKLQDFDFELPTDLIAKSPIEPRDHSRMLVVRNELIDENFSNFLNFINDDDLLIFNNSKVIKANINCKIGERNYTVFLNKHINDSIWSCFTKGLKKINIGDDVVVDEDFTGKVIDKIYDEFHIEFYCKDIFAKLDKYGEIPLPPYMKRKATKADEQSYQTVYADEAGSVACPTAGLHFTNDTFKQIKARNIQHIFITLHVGAGTFLPVKTSNINDHKMHSEYFEITENEAKIINEAKSQNRRIVVIGTTALRALESAALTQGIIRPYKGETNIFITPGYKFKIADLLLTNFHLPKSTLLMLISAFCGYKRIKKAYNHAIKNNYRFYSYGDCCLLYRMEDIND